MKNKKIKLKKKSYFKIINTKYMPKPKPLTSLNQGNPEKVENKKKKILRILLSIGVLIVIASVIFLIVKIVSSEPESDASVTDTFDDETKIFSKTNLVVTSSQVILAEVPKTVIYITTATSTGDLGGREGADTFCADNQPSNLSAGCTNIHAFLGVTSEDEIRDMPANYDYFTSYQIYWWHNDNETYNSMADNWTDLLNGSIAMSQEDGTGNGNSVWSGSNPNGALSEYHCSNWTDGDVMNFGQIGSGTSTDVLWTGDYANFQAKECSGYEEIRYVRCISECDE